MEFKESTVNAILNERDELHLMLSRCYQEMRRWKSCQSIGACRQCVDDGVLLQAKTMLEQYGQPENSSSSNDASDK